MAFESGPAGCRGFYGLLDENRKKKRRCVQALAKRDNKIDAIKILKWKCVCPQPAFLCVFFLRPVTLYPHSVCPQPNPLSAKGVTNSFILHSTWLIKLNEKSFPELFWVFVRSEALSQRCEVNKVSFHKLSETSRARARDIAGTQSSPLSVKAYQGGKHWIRTKRYFG